MKLLLTIMIFLLIALSILNCHIEKDIQGKEVLYRLLQVDSSYRSDACRWKMTWIDADSTKVITWRTLKPDELPGFTRWNIDKVNGNY